MIQFFLCGVISLMLAECRNDDLTPHAGRVWVRVFFLALVSIMFVDVFPWGKLSSKAPIQWVHKFVNAAGIWQGQWQMFAPKPSVNNYWMSAQITDSAGQSTDWTSPYWPTIGAWEKFYRFRYMNYYNRISTPLHRHCTPDFARYLAREAAAANGDSPDDYFVNLYANGLNMVDPVDRALPPPEEITWITFSELAARSDD